MRNWVLRLGAQRVALEPTGRYHRALHQGLVEAGIEAGIEVVVVNPRWSRHFARALGQEAKNDPVDAAVLALYARLQVAQGSQPKARNLQGLSDLVAARRNLVGHRQSLRKSASEFCAAAASSLEPVIAECSGNIRELEAKMQALIADDEALRRRAAIIQSVPGCGFVNAASLCADLPELGTVSARKAAALIGVAPYDCDSGTSQGRHRIRGGREHPRHLLYMAATAAIRWNPDLKAVYERLTGDGKDHKLAMVAVMRKLIALLGALLRDDRLWMPAAPAREVAA